jgi:hypothetical protein
MKSILQKIVLSLVCLLLLQGLSQAQCYPDRHNTTLNNQWISCTSTQNPNPTRGTSHWIQYSLEEIKALGDVHLWNVNMPDHLDDGSNSIAIDVSVDGSNWTEVYMGNLPQAAGSSIYEGLSVVDLQGTSARYIVLTALTNHGGSCYGLGEVRIQLTDFPCLSTNYTVVGDPIATGVYSADEVVETIGSVDSEVYLFGGDEVRLGPGFEVEVGSVFYGANTPCQN